MTDDIICGSVYSVSNRAGFTEILDQQPHNMSASETTYNPEMAMLAAAYDHLNDHNAYRKQMRESAGLLLQELQNMAKKMQPPATNDYDGRFAHYGNPMNANPSKTSKYAYPYVGVDFEKFQHTVNLADEECSIRSVITSQSWMEHLFGMHYRNTFGYSHAHYTQMWESYGRVFPGMDVDLIRAGCEKIAELLVFEAEVLQKSIKMNLKHPHNHFAGKLQSVFQKYKELVNTSDLEKPDFDYLTQTINCTRTEKP